MIGADYAPSDKFTIAGDVVGWTKEHAAVYTPDVLPGATLYQTSPDSVTSLYGAVGGKINVARLWLVTASVLFPLRTDAARVGVAPVIGFERSF